jgi:hypothetical protein
VCLKGSVKTNKEGELRLQASEGGDGQNKVRALSSFSATKTASLVMNFNFLWIHAMYVYIYSRLPHIEV